VVSIERTDCAKRLIGVRDYNLHATLDSGQTFRWTRENDAWTGVIGRRWIHLQPLNTGILATTAGAPGDWKWLTTYLQTAVDLDRILTTLPVHPYLSDAVRAHRGLRLLRQEPWECLASFILSSNKQIRHIKTIVQRLCEVYGDPIVTPEGRPPAWAFPRAEQIARVGESDLRALGMGFRAPYLLQTAEKIANGECVLEELHDQSIAEARAALMTLPGVGRKIADCALLFGLGFDEAFPVDIWVMNVLQTHWFRGKKTSLRNLIRFAETSFGPYGGYAQQYLFHFARTRYTGSSKTIAT